MIKRLIRLRYYLPIVLLVAMACDDPPEVLRKDLTIAEVQNVFQEMTSRRLPAGREECR